MRTIIVLLFALLVAAAPTSPAAADSEGDRQECTSGNDRDNRIAACTRCIKRGGKKADLAIAYFNRGEAYSDIEYRDKRNVDRAIADYGQAIKLDPNNAFAYRDRGRAYERKGDLDRAIADYSQAIKVNPNLDLAYRDRGEAYKSKGEHDRAIADFNAYYKMPSGPRSPAVVADAPIATRVGQPEPVYPQGPPAEPSAAPSAPPAPEPRVAAAPSSPVTETAPAPSSPAATTATPAGQPEPVYPNSPPAEPAAAPSAPQPAAPSASPPPVAPVETAAAPVAQPAPALPAPPAVPPGKRVALVIGNSGYRHIGALDNPANDARLIAAALKDAGFELIGGSPRLDLDKAGFDAAVQEFGAKLQGAEVGLFYYAGHGVQVRGANFLAPVNANPTRDADVDFQMIDTNLVLRQMEASGTRLNLVMLDACRNNPFSGRGLRSSSGGLAQMQAPEGTLISFATQPGNVAQDGTDGNSPYTKALAEIIRLPGLDILRAFNQVGLKVKKATGGAQQPWQSSSPIEGEFFFKPAS